MSRKLIISSIAAIVISAGLSLYAGTQARADVDNPNITVDKGELQAKCARSGGDWKVEKNGVYRCVVHNNDSTTVVECKDGKCDGYIFEKAKPAGRRSHQMINRSGGYRIIR